MPKGPFLDWLGKVSAELKVSLARGCDRYSIWRDVLDGSTKQLRRPAEEISIVAHLFQARFSAQRQNESRVPSHPRPRPRAGGPLSPMRHLPPQRSSQSSQSMNPHSGGYLTPTTTGTNTPSSTSVYSSVDHQTNHIVALNATYSVNSQPSLQSHDLVQDGASNALPAGPWAGPAIDPQTFSHMTLNHEMSGALHPHGNAFPMFIFRGQGRAEEPFPESQVPLNSFQSQEDIQAEEFSDPAFFFANPSDHENAGDSASVDDLFSYV